MKVIVTDGSYLHTLAIARYLGRQGIEVYPITNSKTAVCLYSKYCQKGLIAPSPERQDEYIKFLRQVTKDGLVDLLIPVGARATYVIAKNKRELEQIIKVEIADRDSIALALNKRRTYELAERMGVPYPRTIYPQTFEELEELSQNLDYPVVIKGLFEAGRQIVDYPSSSEEFVRKYHTMCEQNNFKPGSLPMIQEYIRADSVWSFSAVYQKGICKRVFMFKEIRSCPVKGGVASYAESFYDQRLKEYGMVLLDALNWHGVAHVEFKPETKTGELKLMEINPKFWAATDVALKAGVNFPYYLCQMARGEELEYSEEYNRNLRFHFPFSRELQHIRQKPGSLPRVIMDTLNPKVKSNVWLSDFKPNFFELLFGLASLLPTRIKSLLKGMIGQGIMGEEPEIPIVRTNQQFRA